MGTFPASVLTLLIFLALYVTIVAWSKMIGRMRRGQALLPVEPRHDVPWFGRDVLAVLLLYLVAGTMLAGVFQEFVLPKDLPSKLFTGGPDELAKAHPINNLFVKADWLARIACTLVAVVVAPIFEEIFFRLLLQGWLEKLDRRLRRRFAKLFSFCRWGTLPVVFTSALFALLHLRGEQVALALDQIMPFVLSEGMLRVIVVVVIIVLAQRFRGATWSDLGWMRENLWPDVRLGLSAAAVTIVPLYVVQLFLQYVMDQLLPSYVSSDPIPLFFFALVLGTLYLRTHRIVPSIVAHAALNGVGMIAMWLQVFFGTF